MICQFITTEANGTYHHRCVVCGDERTSTRPKYVKACSKRPKPALWRYAAELMKWLLAGCPSRTKEEVAAILETHCKPCSLYRETEDGNGRCGGCGCKLAKEGTLQNKIAMATAHCPGGKW